MLKIDVFLWLTLNWTVWKTALHAARVVVLFDNNSRLIFWFIIIFCVRLLTQQQMTVCSYHVTYTFQSEFPLYNCLNVKELLARNSCDIWNLSDCNWTRTHNHLVRKRTLNHLAKLAKWLSCVVSTYLYCAFDCMFLSCHVRVNKSLIDEKN